MEEHLIRRLAEENDRILRDEIERLREVARAFGERVLFCDNYGCSAGPGRCLHADASRFLKEIQCAE